MGPARVRPACRPAITLFGAGLFSVFFGIFDETGLFYRFQLGFWVVFSAFLVPAGLFYRKIAVL